MKISKSDLISVLKSVKGSTFVNIETVTEPQLLGGKSCPFNGITKHSIINGCIGFKYENSVNNQRLREASINDFKSEPRKWGTKIPNTPLVEHQGTYYLEVKVEKTEQPVYVLSGKIIDNKEIIPYIPKISSRQDLVKEVILRDFKIDSISRIKINKTQYEVV